MRNFARTRREITQHPLGKPKRKRNFARVIILSHIGMAEDSLKEKTAKGIFWGGISNGLQQLLGLVFGICLARLLTREDYGMVGMLSIISLTASTLQESGFIAALANRKKDCHEGFNAVFWCSLFIGISLYVILFFCAPLIAAFYQQPELIPLSRVAFLGFLISSMGTAQSAYLFRHVMVKQRAIAIFIGIIVSNLTGITLAFNGYGYWSLAIQSNIYVAVVTSCLWYFSPWRPTFTFNLRPAREMWGFSSKLLVTNIFQIINNNFLSVILGRYYGEGKVGDFNQANKWNYMGYQFIYGMINNVAQPILANVADEKARQRHIFRKMLRFTAFIAFPTLFGMSFISRELILVTITEKWIVSADLMRMLCIGSAFTVISGLYAQLMVSKGKSQIFMYSTVSLSLVQLAVMLLNRSAGLYAMTCWYVAINICWLAVWQFFIHREIGLTWFQAAKDILPYAACAAFTMCAVGWLTAGIGNLYLLLTAKIAGAVALYTLLMRLSGSVTFKESIHYLLHRK